MKKGLRRLLVVLALATAFVCAMAVATFAAESMSAGHIDCNEGWNYGGERYYTATLTVNDPADYTWYGYGVDSAHVQGMYGSSATVNGVTEGTVYNLYKFNWGSYRWEAVDGVSVTIDVEHVLLGSPTTHAKEATCEEAGYKEYADCACGDHHFAINDETGLLEEIDPGEWCGEGGAGYIAPLGHDWSAWEVREGEFRGYEYVEHQRVCQREDCEAFEFHFTKNEAPRFPEEWIEDVIHQDGDPADCGNPGYKEYYKTDCGVYFEDSEGRTIIGGEQELAAWKAEGGRGYLAPVGNHRWDKGVVQKDGSTLYTCEVCGATKVEKGVATGDTENMALWMMLAIAAMVAAGYVASRKEN